MPAAFAVNAAPIHGSDVAVSTFAPPLPEQPAPVGVARAWHVGKKRARPVATVAFSRNMPPVASNSPVVPWVKDVQVRYSPAPKADHVAPFHRASPFAVTHWPTPEPARVK